jgi:ribosomal protein S17
MAINNPSIKEINIKKTATVSGIAKVHEGTLKVSVESVFEHPIYHKQQKRHRNYLVVCDKDSSFTMGQRVFITPCKRVSKRKSWKILSE